MTLNYQLTDFDFLQYQLYQSSISKSHKKRRRYNRIIVSVILLLCGLFLTIRKDDYYALVIYGSIAIAWFICFPFYSTWRYKKHFKKHVEENYKDQINIPTEVNISEGFIYAKDAISESKINGNEIKELIETKDHFFAKLTTNIALIVPKHAITDLDTFRKLITNLGADYVDELNWRWN